MGITVRLSVLLFFQFAVWGCYLVSIGQYLGAAGLGAEIQWFYAVGGIAALFMPAIVGTIADRYVPAQLMLACCHAAAAMMKFALWVYAATHPRPEFGTFFALYSIAVALYIPTIALCNSTSLTLLKRNGKNPVKVFPKIRVWGTVGFVAAMWLVNSAWIDTQTGTFGFTFSATNPHAMQRFQYTEVQLLASAIIGVITAVYAASLPKIDVCRHTSDERKCSTALIRAMRMPIGKGLLTFFIFSMLIGVALQINNCYTTPFLTHFRDNPMYADTFGANNATFLSSLSQISEALWMLPVGCVLARIGIKRTLIVAMLAWAANFACFALGDTGSGVWLIVTAMILYGVAFDFFNVAGALYVDKCAPNNGKSGAQGVFMMMTKGIGATLGMGAAGAVVNNFCKWDAGYLTGNWHAVWWIFTGYCITVTIVFILIGKLNIATDENRKSD
jgi:NHS family nucleoside permease-like MFS transporter/NHS family xanthosine MFS transporter